MRVAYPYRQIQTSAAGAEIGVGGTKVFTFKLPETGGWIRRIAIERTAGDCASFDWKLYSTSSGDATIKTINTIDSGAAVVPGGGVDLDSSYTEGQKPFVNQENQSRLYVAITANGGAAGGNLFTVVLQIEAVPSNMDAVTISS